MSKLYGIKELMLHAEENNYAIGAFNFSNMETALAILEAGSELNTNVILLGSNAEMPTFGLKLWIEMAENLSRKFPEIKTGLHLDHTTQIDFIKSCLDMGTPSVMYDGSNLPFSENIKNTRKVVEIASHYNASVEGELGSIGRCDDLTFEGVETDRFTLTDPKDAKLFVEETRVDALAVSIGNSHGLGKSLPVLDFELLEELNSVVPAYIVLHGGSGIPEEQLKKAVSLGIRKVNVASEIGYAYTKTVSKYAEEVWWGEAIYHGKQAVKEVVKRWIKALKL